MKGKRDRIEVSSSQQKKKSQVLRHPGPPEIFENQMHHMHLLMQKTMMSNDINPDGKDSNAKQQEKQEA